MSRLVWSLTYIALFTFAAVSQDKAPDKCSLAGTVVNAVTAIPLSKVELVAEPLGEEDRTKGSASTTTDSKGNFLLVDLPPGSYRLRALRNGYLDAYYGARRTDSQGATIQLDAGQELKDLQIKLRPFGSIAGTVRDTDGEAMIGAVITLVRQRFEAPGRRVFEERAVANTDDSGQYRIADLEPGHYYVRAERRGAAAYGAFEAADHSAKLADRPLPQPLLPTLYPGVVDPSLAKSVAVDSGARVSGIDIMLVRSRVFTVKVKVSAPAGLAVLGAWLWPADFEKLALTFYPIQVGLGTFELRGVPAGSYVVTSNANVPEAPDTPDRHYYGAAVPLTVTGDVEELRVAITSGAEFAGRVTYDKEVADADRTGLANLTVRLRRGDAGADAHVLKDGSFQANIGVGNYLVDLETPPTLVIQSIRSQHIDVYAEGLTTAEGGKVPLDIVLASTGGKVDGVVLDKDDKPVQGATVLLVAEPKLRLRSDSFHECATDQYGRYHFDNIRPADYKLFAWDDVEPKAWLDPDFLKPIETRGEAVALKAKGHETMKLHVQ